MKTHVIMVNGVLRKPVGGAVIPEGADLYRGLAAVGGVIPVLHDTRDGQVDEVRDWLELHGMIHHPFVSTEGVMAAHKLRLDGYDLGLIVVAMPEEAMFHIRAGLNTLLFTHAQYAMPTWRPDSERGVRPWADIIDEASALAAMKAKDARLRSEE